MEKQQRIEIGQRLRQRRQELGLTREKMSELADIGTGYYGQLEVGTSQMSIDTLIKLSRSMHLPMEYLLFGEGYTPGDPSGKSRTARAGRTDAFQSAAYRQRRRLDTAAQYPGQ